MRHPGTRRVPGNSGTQGTRALGYLRHSGTRVLKALGHLATQALGHSSTQKTLGTWALEALEVLYLADSGACEFWKDVNSIMHGKTIILLNQARVTSVTKVIV